MWQNRNTIKHAKDACKRNPLRKKEVVFDGKDFKDKEFIYVLAKTWGAANYFFENTKLSKFQNVEIEFLSKKQQLGYGKSKLNTIVILISGEDNSDNRKLIMNRLEQKHITVLEFDAIGPAEKL